MTWLWTSADLIAAMHGRPIGNLPLGVTGISIDSRAIAPGEAFFAIKGDRVDGHDFASFAVANGAGLLVVSEGKLPALGRLVTPMIVVQDVLQALIDLGCAARDRTAARIIAGNFWGKTGPVDGIAAEPVYLDISVPPGKTKRLPVDTYRSAFAYIFAGSGTFRDASKPFGVKVEKEYQGEELNIRDLSGNRTLVVFDTGDEVTVQAGEKGIRFLLVSGKPIQEPVAWHGPIVMNTQEELQQAMRELRNGTFIKPAH